MLPDFEFHTFEKPSQSEVAYIHQKKRIIRKTLRWVKQIYPHIAGIQMLWARLSRFYDNLHIINTKPI